MVALVKSQAITNGVPGIKNVKEMNGIKSEIISVKQNNGVDGWRANLDEDDYAVLGLRNFIFDICNQNGGGHGGSAIGMAAIGVALYKYTMRYDPSDPTWFDRDRFVLSNGNTAFPLSFEPGD